MGNFLNNPILGDRSYDLTWRIKGRTVQYDYKGKKFVFVGGTAGIGRAMAKLAASKGADVTVIGRTFKDEGIPNIKFIYADLSSLKEAARVADKIPGESLDALVMTTGFLMGVFLIRFLIFFYYRYSPYSLTANYFRRA